MKLLSYLYQEALDNCSNEHYPVLLSLLKTSCEPYTRWGPGAGPGVGGRGCLSWAWHHTQSKDICEHLLGQTPAVGRDHSWGGEGRVGGLPGQTTVPHGCHAYPIPSVPASPLACPPGRFIHDWVYSGVFRDVYGEFMIQVNHEYLGFRGRWRLAVGSHGPPRHQAGAGQPRALCRL